MSQKQRHASPSHPSPPPWWGASADPHSPRHPQHERFPEIRIFITWDWPHGVLASDRAAVSSPPHCASDSALRVQFVRANRTLRLATALSHAQIGGPPGPAGRTGPTRLAAAGSEVAVAEGKVAPLSSVAGPSGAKLAPRWIDTRGAAQCPDDSFFAVLRSPAFFSLSPLPAVPFIIFFSSFFFFVSLFLFSLRLLFGRARNASIDSILLWAFRLLLFPPLLPPLPRFVTVSIIICRTERKKTRSIPFHLSAPSCPCFFFFLCSDICFYFCFSCGDSSPKQEPRCVLVPCRSQNRSQKHIIVIVIIIIVTNTITVTIITTIVVVSYIYTVPFGPNRLRSATTILLGPLDIRF